MKQRYVVLRQPPPVRSGGAASPLNKTGSAAQPTIETEELDARRAADLAKKREVKTVAPVMPMRLIEPLGGDAVIAADGGLAWGVRAVRADTSPFDGAEIVVAVLDTGIDPAHPAFAGVELERKNFTSGGDDDENGHGTHCAGTVFGRDVEGARIGIATGVKKALIGKVLGPNGGGSDQIAKAIQWAADGGAHVISLSLGIDFPGYVRELEGEGVPTELATSIALEGYRKNLLLFESLATFLDARGAFAQPSVLIAAAGNESLRGGAQEIAIAVSPPAVAEGFVSVAALAHTPQGFAVASFSNIGARVSGPGVNIVSAALGGGLRHDSGTSMATPHVAGVAALWAQKLSLAGELNGRLLTERLIGSATNAGFRPGSVPADVGAGLVQAPQN